MLQINLKIGAKRIGWQFHFAHDARFQSAFILPWAIGDYRILAEDTALDFLVSVYPKALPATDALGESFVNFPRTKFILSCEPSHRFLNLPSCFSIVSGPQNNDHSGCRYGPTMCSWCPPLTETRKTRCCSAIDSGRHPWRIGMIRDFMQTVTPVDVFGTGTTCPLPGYHETVSDDLFGNSKYLGLMVHGFHLSMENRPLTDYWTEKVSDAIMCETVPVYLGCPNLSDYFIPESFVAWPDAPRVNWSQWQAEYASRHKYVLMQKEILRTKLNIWSYFNVITNDLSLLDKRRPITR